VFTGIVEYVGKVVALEPRERLLGLVIDAGPSAEGVRVGDSVAVNGACLTVTRVAGATLGFEAVRETLDRTSLADLRPGSPVNLERALRADGRLDGHIVQGHVDEAGRVRALRRSGADVQLVVGCSRAFADWLVPKGSVAVDGVALTLVRLGDEDFEVALIPHTLAVTTLGSLREGDRVNLEADVLGKYVKRYLERVLPAAERGR
jgi:riboflavin synthase